MRGYDLIMLDQGHMARGSLGSGGSTTKRCLGVQPVLCHECLRTVGWCFSFMPMADHDKSAKI